ncbi:MAG: carboxypeptidase regulatory-like domain-containing protein [Acidobacteriota bacterium]
MKKLSLIALSLLFVLSFTPALLAQQDTASITGIVTDASGAVVPGVKVVLTNPSTGVRYQAVTNAAGSYTINEVKPGPGYDATFTHDGFTTVAVKGMYLNIGATRTQNAAMTVGNVVTTVAVSAASQDVTLNTTDATVGNNFQVQFVNDLPILNRDSPAALFTQQPGITLDGAVTGARVDQDNVTLDGLDVNDNETGNFGAIVAHAPVDSVQEFRGTTAGELASAGEGGGGQFTLVTRSGSNQFHGNVEEYHRDTDLEANDWFNNNDGVPRPPLIRNQFGGTFGGPIRKDKLFFFFNYEGRRDTLSNLITRTVPLNNFRNSTISYLNAAGGTSTLTSAQVAALDPAGIGFDQDMLAFVNKRYPVANDTTVGDQINTGGFHFNAPYPYKEDNYVLRFDYNLSSNMKLWAVGHDTRVNGTQSAIQFPGDPETYPFLDKSYTWVVGHSWTIGASKLNQFVIGETFQNYNFPNTYNPPGVNQFETFGGNGSGGAILSAPYARAINAQGRTFPVPIVRDDFSWQAGKHSITFGGSFKWISPHNNTILDYNTPTIGLGGYLSGLTAAQRPPDIAGGNATALYDSAFALALAPYTSVGATYNYDAQGNPIPQGTGAIRDYRYYETELYVGDAWKVTPNLTLSYGLRWQNYTVPYERHGLESVDQMGIPGGAIDSVDQTTFDHYFSARVAQSAAGQSGNLAVPLFDYILGGKANHAPGLYHTDNKDFAPRIAFAWNPSFDRKTVFSGGAGIIYDHTVVNAVLYQQTQFSYLFQSVTSQPLGTPHNTAATLQQDQRFSSISNPPAPPAAPAITKPFYPFVSGSGANAVPNGLANGGAFNEMIDPGFKTPYSIQYNFGMEHQLPHGFLIKIDYAGRQGRRLLAQADTSQLIDFPDTASGQLYSQAFANMSQQLRAGVATTAVNAQPWYENVLPAGLGASLGYANNTQLVADNTQPYGIRGDFADDTFLLSAFGILPPNVGMASQFDENTMYTNKGFSSYNGLLTTLHKNLGGGLQFDLNYTWSHSIDNVSVTANTVAYGGYGFICDVLRPRECRGNSDFDITNTFNGNFIYDLPIGRGKQFAAGLPIWADRIVGGWEVSGLPTWHTGYPYFAAANAFVAGYANNAPAILTGSVADLQTKISGGKGKPLYAYANPAKANADYTGPIGFTIGSRNNLYGPHYFDLDLGLGKSFPLWENVLLKLRADAFDALNHPNFSTPCTDITNASCNFGVIATDAGGNSPSGFPTAVDGQAYRVLQVIGRIEF